MKTFKTNYLSTTNNELETRVMLAGSAGAEIAPGVDVLQYQIDSISQAGGGAISLQAGEYRQSEPLVLKSNVSISGEGSDTVIRWDPALNETINQPLITNENTPITNVELSFLKIRGPLDVEDLANPNSISKHEQHGILIEGEGKPLNGEAVDNSSLKLTDVEVRNFAAHGVHIKGTDKITLNDAYVHQNGVSDTDLYHNLYLRRASNVNVSNSTFEKSPAGHGVRAAETKNLYIGSSKIRYNGDHGIHITEGTNLFEDKDMYINDGNDFESSNNMQNPRGIARDFTSWQATRTWVTESPVISE